MAQISVIIPCFNCEDYLAAAIDSVLVQTKSVFEIIIVDDGSTDRSVDVAEGLVAAGRVKLIRQVHKGVSAARNAGIDAATGDHMLFLDADDLLHPQALENLAAAVEAASGRVGIMGCAWFETTPDVTSSVFIPKMDDDFFPRILTGNIGPVHTCLIPSELMRRAGCFREGQRFFEDWECICRIALQGARLAPTAFVGAYYRRHGVSTFARAKPAEVARGHVTVMETLSHGILQRDDLLMKHGTALFWGTWTAIHHAREVKVPWCELEELSKVLATLARCGPKSIRKSRYAQSIRVLGVRCSETLRSLIARPASKTDESCAVAVT